MRKLSFATTIQSLRLRNELEPADLAALTGIREEVLLKAEQGEPVRFSSYQITELADALFCNRQYLLDLYGWRKGDDTICDYLEFLGNQAIWMEIGDMIPACFQSGGTVMAAG